MSLGHAVPSHVIAAGSHHLARQGEGDDQCGGCENHLDHFVSPKGERTQMFVSLVESGEPRKTFHHASSRKRERLWLRRVSCK
jgi:hypothetical protein